MSTHDTRSTPKVHTKAEAAVLLRVRESWLERRAAARDIPFTMLGGAYHFTDEHLAEIVRMNESIPAAKAPGQPERPRSVRRRGQNRADDAPVVLLRPRPRPDGPRRKAAAA